MTKANPNSGDSAVITGDSTIAVYIDGKLLQVIDTDEESKDDGIKIDKSSFNKPTA